MTQEQMGELDLGNTEKMSVCNDTTPATHRISRALTLVNWAKILCGEETVDKDIEREMEEKMFVVVGKTVFSPNWLPSFSQQQQPSVI